MRKPPKITPSRIRRLSAAIEGALTPSVTAAAVELGYELYAVGGCIRNPLLGRDLGDLDLAVVGDAVRLARRVARSLNVGQVAIYSRFGTALVRCNGLNMEFATARRESYDANSRKPAEVVSVSIEEDLARRDFTINALALGLVGPRRGELLDLFDGLGDLGRRLLRTPLDPDRTFSDDPLRMMRAVRFAAELGFNIDEGAWAGIVRNVGRLTIVASERIGEEFWKMMAGKDPVRAVGMLLDSGLSREFIPELDALAGVEQIGRHHHKDVLKHTLKVMQNVAHVTDDPIIRLSGLLHDIGKPLTKRFIGGQGWTFHGHENVGAKMTRRIGRRLGYGRDDLNRLVKLVRLHMRPVNLTSDGVTDSAIRRLMVELGEDLDAQLILCRADITTANPRLVDTYLANFYEMSRRMNDVEARDKMRRFQSPVRGEEIMELCGIEAGPMVGALKGRVEDAILDGEIPYDYDAAKAYLLKIKDKVLDADPNDIRREQRERVRWRRRITSDIEVPQ